MTLYYTDFKYNATTESPIAQVEDYCPHCKVFLIEYDIFNCSKHPKFKCSNCGGFYTLSKDNQKFMTYEAK